MGRLWGGFGGFPLFRQGILLQPHTGAAKGKHESGEENVFPQSHGIDPVIGDQGIEQRYAKANARLYQAKLQGVYKIAYAQGKGAHLEKGIEGKCHQHTSRYPVANGIEQFNQKGMHPGVVVAVGNDAQHLLKLV
ncbi:hypothetical protein IMSAGC019_03098 [Lachnospiraceae bacterium]|nr:hypothetical protein IMSAGC019_03098 [Lachnospiraceae bacterium]